MCLLIPKWGILFLKQQVYTAHLTIYKIYIKKINVKIYDVKIIKNKNGRGTRCVVKVRGAGCEVDKMADGEGFELYLLKKHFSLFAL